MTDRTAAFRYATAMVLALVVVSAIGCNRNSGSNANSGSAPPATGSSVALARVYPNLSFASPVAMLQAPSDSTRWFVVERGSNVTNGRVIVFPNANTVTSAQTSVFISIPVNASGEGGLLGMAFHPNFPATPQVFLSYTRTGPNSQQLPLTSVISRFTSNDGGATLDAASERVILTADHPFTNHKGGNIAFDRLGNLFIGLGDGGSANDPQNNGQNVNTLLGKMLRIDVDSMPAPNKSYAIPSDNPFAASGGAPEIYAWGFRNPWRWSFDRATDRLWLGDVGQGAWEELDIVVLGGNYGWKDCEGAHLRGSSAACTNPAFTNPIAEYDHAQGCSITGGHVYRGATIPSLFGVYLFGDFCTGTIWTLRETAGGAPLVQAAIPSGLPVVSFGQSNDGEVYVVNFNGTLHKIIPAP